MFENFKKLSKFRKIITRKGVEVFTNNNKQNREISRKKTYNERSNQTECYYSAIWRLRRHDSYNNKLLESSNFRFRRGWAF